MNSDQPVSWLMFFTFAAVIIIAGVAFLAFLRSQRNRDAAANALAGTHTRSGSTPAGAFPELAGVAILMIVAMGMLALGYSGKSRTETAQMPTPVGGTTTGQMQTPVGSTTGMAQSPGTAETPKNYQPANPAPDVRAAPTGSDTGVGSENGSTGTPK